MVRLERRVDFEVRQQRARVPLSGYLSYRELFGPPGAAMCPSPGAPGTVLGAPACVYGFFMYLAIAVITAIALGRRRTAA